MTDPKKLKEDIETRMPYVAILRMRNSQYTIFANKVEGNVETDKFVTVYSTTSTGKPRKLRLNVDDISEYEENLSTDQKLGIVM